MILIISAKSLLLCDVTNAWDRNSAYYGWGNIIADVEVKELSAKLLFGY